PRLPMQMTASSYPLPTPQPGFRSAGILPALVRASLGSAFRASFFPSPGRFHFPVESGPRLHPLPPPFRYRRPIRLHGLPAPPRAAPPSFPPAPSSAASSASAPAARFPAAPAFRPAAPARPVGTASPRSPPPPGPLPPCPVPPS